MTYLWYFVNDVSTVMFFGRDWVAQEGKVLEVCEVGKHVHVMQLAYLVIGKVNRLQGW